MHAHRVDSYLLTENLKLEIVHESNPYFAGENISLVIKIRHLGSQVELNSLKEKLQELHEEIEAQGIYVGSENEGSSNSFQEDEEQGQSWSMASLLSVVRRSFEGSESQSSSSLDLERQKRQREQLTRQIKYHKPVELMSGYVQIAGMLEIDPDVIGEAKLDKTSVKVVGLTTPSDGPTEKRLANTGEEHGSDQSNNFSKYFHSTKLLKRSNFDEDELKEDNNIVFALGTHDESIEYRQFPILLIPQTLLFSELKLEAGETKVFRFKSGKLSQTIPPSYYVSPNMAINYSLEVGMSKFYQGDIKQDTIKIPINVAPFVSKSGGQYPAILNEKVVIMEPGVVKEARQIQNIGGKMNHNPVQSSTSRKTSGFGLVNSDKNRDVDRLIQNFVRLVESSQDDFGDIDELVDSQMEIQFPEDTSDESPTISNSDEKQEDDGGYMTRRKSIVSTNVSDLERLTITQSTKKMGYIEENGLIPQLDNLRNTYQINWNGQSITKIIYSKPFYTMTDDIDIVLELDRYSPPAHKVSAVTVSLESCESVNPRYATDVENVRKPQINCICTAHAICFDDCDRIPLKLIIPKAPIYQLTSQFKTDIFQLKWMLGVKFVLVPRISSIGLERFYEDKKGILYHAKEALEGEEFSCHIPLTILPSSSMYGGW